MTEQEEIFVHFSSCIVWLNNAWRLLQAIQREPSNSLVGPAFRFALVEYCKPYKFSRGVNRQFKLDTRLIPEDFRPDHQRIVNARDQVHAHSDLTIMQAKLYVHESLAQRYVLIAQDIITGVEELPNLLDVVALVEATLDNMYVEEKVLEAALPP